MIILTVSRHFGNCSSGTEGSKAALTLLLQSASLFIVMAFNRPVDICCESNVFTVLPTLDYGLIPTSGRYLMLHCKTPLSMFVLRKESVAVMGPSTRQRTLVCPSSTNAEPLAVDKTDASKHSRRNARGLNWRRPHWIVVRKSTALVALSSSCWNSTIQKVEHNSYACKQVDPPSACS